METGTFGDKTPQRSDFVFDCPQALVGTVAGGRFARVQFVMPAVPGEGDVGHDDVGAGSQRFGLTVCRQSFHRGGGGDVDVRQQKPGQRRHFQGRVQRASGGVFSEACRGEE